MTAYRREDLDNDWEFKILRSTTSQFKNPETLRQVLEEEARAGWVLVEKFDNQRIRLKRRASASKNDAALGFDPYRTYVGLSEANLVAIILAVVFGVLLAGIAVAVILSQK